LREAKKGFAHLEEFRWADPCPAQKVVRALKLFHRAFVHLVAAHNKNF
jgi:hypothetical protein